MLQGGLENCFCVFLFLTLSTVICCGSFPVTNELVVGSFGQKRVLNAENVNVNVQYVLLPIFQSG